MCFDTQGDPEQYYHDVSKKYEEENKKLKKKLREANLKIKELTTALEIDKYLKRE